MKVVPVLVVKKKKLSFDKKNNRKIKKKDFEKKITQDHIGHAK